VAKDAELVVLRHEYMVLRRHVRGFATRRRTGCGWRRSACWSRGGSGRRCARSPLRLCWRGTAG
jgi:hypothetical protein